MKGQKNLNYFCNNSYFVCYLQCTLGILESLGVQFAKTAILFLTNAETSVKLEGNTKVLCISLILPFICCAQWWP